ncbi:hypothetical protein [Streptomyces sp. WM6378]|uniref:hypothetical protein n=1 Tax=Streptomyces sp. WM6378 TaxID=1415557 RepID=UPI0007C7E1BE
MLWHENAVLRRQFTPPVRYETADRLWFTALSSTLLKRILAAAAAESAQHGVASARVDPIATQAKAN